MTDHRLIRFGEHVIAGVLGKRHPKLSAKLISMIDEFLTGESHLPAPKITMGTALG